MKTLPKQVILGTRGSDLARWQTQYIATQLQSAHAELESQTQIFTTKGDRILDTPLPLVGGKGLFTAELEAALRSGEVDLAVHSLKDLPTEMPEGLALGAIPVRVNPADVMVSRNQYTLETLPEGAVIGTSSRRRAAQLLNARPDLKMLDIRGNVDTRIAKAYDPDGPYDAIILAYAGLLRLEKQDVVSYVFEYDEMLPAPGQGALGVQCRDDGVLLELLNPIHHLETALAVTAERGFLAGLGGGCSVPVAAHGQVVDNVLELKGRVSAVDGSSQIDVSINVTDPTPETALAAGHKLAEEAIGQGANVILEETH